MAKVIIPLSDYGHDPTELAVPFDLFTQSGLTVHFATESGASPRCDSRMLEGLTGWLLGAPAAAKKAYNHMISSKDDYPGSIQTPLAWTDPTFDLRDYDLVFLPGGHDKGVRQIIDSDDIHQQLAAYFPLTIRSEEAKPKVLAAICHGVQVLAFTKPDPSSDKSMIHDCKTTALPGHLESSISKLTWPFLGDYYKTYGAGSPNVEDFVKKGLDQPNKQFVQGPTFFGVTTPVVIEDTHHRYVSGRYPPDAEAVAKRAVELVHEVQKK